MNLLVAANDKYFYPMFVTLESFFDNNQFEHHNIFFMFSDIRESQLAELKTFVEKNGRATLVTKYVDENDFEGFPISHHFSIEVYYRFLAHVVVPESEDRVLWLDSDMIIKKSLQEYYYQDFEGKYLVVCPSINENAGDLLSKLKCPAGTVYFNSGNVLFNVKKIRESITIDDYHSYFLSHKDQITWLDQDILNGMYACRTKLADYRVYNYQFFNETSFSPEERWFISEKTAILHYIGGIKPWHGAFTNELRSYWRFYAKKALPVSHYSKLRREYLTSSVKRSTSYQFASHVFYKAKRTFRRLFSK